MTPLKKALTQAFKVWGSNRSPKECRDKAKRAIELGWVRAKYNPKHPDFEARRTTIAKLRILGFEVRGWNDDT